MGNKMSKTTTSKNDEMKEQVNEVVPDPIDDQDIAQDRNDQVFEQVAQSDNVEEAGPEIVTLKPGEDKRLSITQRYREKRDAERDKSDEEDDGVIEANTEINEDDVESDVDDDSGKPAEAVEAEEDSQKEQESENEPASQPTEITLIVDGKEVKKPLSEVTALAQIAAAGNDRLEEAKRILKETKEAAQALRDQAPENQPGVVSEQETQQTAATATGGDQANQPNPPVDKENLRVLVEKLQVGDVEEGVEAVAELFSHLQNTSAPSVSEEQVSALVEQRLTQTKNQTEIHGAIGRFEEKYPEIVREPMLAEAGMTALRFELIKDLKSVGVTDEDISSISRNTEALVQAQKRVSQGGHKLRSYDELLDSVGSTMTEKFNLRPSAKPSPKTPSSQSSPPVPQDNVAVAKERLERKRAAPRQPRSAGMRTASAAKKVAKKTPAQIVAEARKSRGFAPTS